MQQCNIIKMNIKVYYEDEKSTMGGWEVVSIFKLILWIVAGRIKPKETSTTYYIRKIETISGKRI